MTNLPGKDWRPWGTRANMYPKVEVWQRGSVEVETVNPRELPAHYDVANLYWRPCVSNDEFKKLIAATIRRTLFY